MPDLKSHLIALRDIENWRLERLSMMKAYDLALEYEDGRTLDDLILDAQRTVDDLSRQISRIPD